MFISVFKYLSRPIEFSLNSVIKKHPSVFPPFQIEGHHLISLSLSLSRDSSSFFPIKGVSFSSYSSPFLVPHCPLSPSSFPSQQPIERSTLSSLLPLYPPPPSSLPLPLHCFYYESLPQTVSSSSHDNSVVHTLKFFFFSVVKSTIVLLLLLSNFPLLSFLEPFVFYHQFIISFSLHTQFPLSFQFR